MSNYIWSLILRFALVSALFQVLIVTALVLTHLKVKYKLSVVACGSGDCCYQGPEVLAAIRPISFLNAAR